MAALTGIGLTILGQTNVIVRNMAISKVEAEYGDAVTVQESVNVWVDHCDLSATREGVDKDFYDGLVDLSHAADFVTVSHTYFHDHVCFPSSPLSLFLLTPFTLFCSEKGEEEIQMSVYILTVVKSKGTLVGHSDKNADEDTGYLHVTYANNHFYNVRSRGPLLRFGTAHKI